MLGVGVGQLEGPVTAAPFQILTPGSRGVDPQVSEKPTYRPLVRMANGTQADGRPYASLPGDVRVALRMTRTEWAEQFAADLASKPLLQEFVFKNPKYQGATEKEVCDLLLTLRNDAIPVQMKFQEDPNSRAVKRLERWIVKRAPEALGQLQGTIRSNRERNFW